MSITKKRLTQIREEREDNAFVPNFMAGVDRLTLILAGVIPASEEEKKNARLFMNQINEGYEVVYAKVQKRLAKKAARKAKVVRGGRP